MSATNREPTTLQTIYDIVQQRFVMQFQSIDSLDSKASTLIALNGIIIAVILNSRFARINLFFSIIAAACLLGSMCLSFAGYKVEDYRRDPDPRNLKLKYCNSQNEEVIEKLTDNLIHAYEENRTKLSKKARYINQALAMVLLGLFCLFLSLLLGGGESSGRSRQETTCPARSETSGTTTRDKP